MTSEEALRIIDLWYSDSTDIWYCLTEEFAEMLEVARKALKQEMEEEMMGRLTEGDNSGNWCLKGVKWEQLYVGQPITEDMWVRLYGALSKLKDYEDTELSPEDIERLNTFEDSNAQLLLKEIAKHEWIPVEERMPEKEGCYLCTVEDDLGDGEITTFVCVLIYEGGRWDDDGLVTAWMPLSKPYRAEDSCEEREEKKHVI